MFVRATLSSLLLFFAWSAQSPLPVRSLDQGRFKTSAAQKAPPPSVKKVVPDVVVRGAKGVTLTLRGFYLRSLKTISVTLCNNNSLELSVTPIANSRAAVRLPDDATADVCILRVGQANDTVPVAIADESLSRWPRPSQEGNWYGNFVGESETSSMATLMGFEIENSAWVLGKNKSGVMRIKAVDKAQKYEDGTFSVTVHLPGVQEGDVQWGDEDESHFWIARVSPGGAGLIDFQPLAMMIREPSRPISR